MISSFIVSGGGLLDDLLLLLFAGLGLLPNDDLSGTILVLLLKTIRGVTVPWGKGVGGRLG